MPDPDDNILTLQELSAYLRIPESTLYKIAREGGVPAQKIGKHWRFNKKAIDSWIASGERKEIR
jgi:excisionase family DNA binding protein